MFSLLPLALLSIYFFNKWKFGWLSEKNAFYAWQALLLHSNKTGQENLVFPRTKRLHDAQLKRKSSSIMCTVPCIHVYYLCSTRGVEMQKNSQIENKTRERNPFNLPTKYIAPRRVTHTHTHRHTLPISTYLQLKLHLILWMGIGRTSVAHKTSVLPCIQK